MEIASLRTQLRDLQQNGEAQLDALRVERQTSEDELQEALRRVNQQEQTIMALNTAVVNHLGQA